MDVAVLSDSHDNIWKLAAALPHLKAADVVIHCGDLCAPFVVKQIGEGLDTTPVHIVWGNNDGDRYLISRVSDRYSNIRLHGPMAELDLQGRQIAVNHYPQVARGLAHSGKYDLVCYGHDHTANEERINGCLLLNPGEVMGLNGRSGLAVVDLENLKVRWIELGAVPPI